MDNLLQQTGALQQPSSVSQEQLNQLQQWMQNSLVFPGQIVEEEVRQQVADTPQLSAVESLAIYQRSYYARLLSCMREQFPALCYSLGVSTFNAMAQEFLFNYPSTSHTLYDLGKRFPEFLEQTRPDKASPPEEREAWIDFMVELAGFEYLVLTLFDAEGDEGQLLNENSAQASSAQAISEEMLALQKCIRLYDSRFDLSKFYIQVKNNEDPELPPFQPTYTALVRVDYKTRLHLLNHVEYRLLKLIKTGIGLNQALDSLQQQLPEMDVGKLWRTQGGIKQRWLQNGFLKNRI